MDFPDSADDFFSFFINISKQHHRIHIQKRIKTNNLYIYR